MEKKIRLFLLPGYDGRRLKAPRYLEVANRLDGYYRKVWAYGAASTGEGVCGIGVGAHVPSPPQRLNCPGAFLHLIQTCNPEFAMRGDGAHMSRGIHPHPLTFFTASR